MKRLLITVTISAVSVHVFLFVWFISVRSLRVQKRQQEQPKRGTSRMNVLFIMADDMRADLGVYHEEDDAMKAPDGHFKVVTPNLDGLAKRSLVFLRAYAQYSLCGPSRTSLLTGRRPDRTRVFGNFHYWRLVGGDFITLPQLFKRMGYRTLSAGKVFHPSAASSNDSDPVSWSEPVYCRNVDKKFENRSRWPGWNAVGRRKGRLLTDEYSVKFVVKKLASLAPKARTGEQPIFVGLGFRKPHLPLTCPAEFFDLYRDAAALRHSSSDSGSNRTATRDRKNICWEDLVQLRQAYYACVSYVDHLVGRVLDELGSLGLINNTVVVFMADHGFHLGEGNFFGKNTPSEVANRLPVMLSVPGRTDNGVRTSSLVEAVDMFPTLVEAAGLGTVPACGDGLPSSNPCTDGLSLMPLIDRPETVIRDSALSQVLRRQGMQYSLRTKDYRYTMFAHLRHRLDEESGLYQVHVDWDPPGLWTELFDHTIDPDEKINRTADPEYRKIKERLVQELIARVPVIHGVPVVNPKPESVDFNVYG